MADRLVLVGGFSKAGLADPFGDLGGVHTIYPAELVDPNVPGGTGIFVFHLTSDLLLTPHPTSSVVPTKNDPSFLHIDLDRKLVFAAHEDQASPAVSAFRLQTQAAKLLEPINHVPADGEAPCMLSTDNTGKFVAVAKYGGGNVSIWAINDDGSVGSRTAHVDFQGSGPTSRQTSPHAHCVVFHPDNRSLFVNDLGTDKIWVLDFDPSAGTLGAPRVAASVAPGSGPRTAALHPNKKWLYSTNEMTSTLSVFALTSTANGPELETVATVSMLPDGWPSADDDSKRWLPCNGGKWASHVCISPDGKFVYAGNRLHDTIAVFRIVDESTGMVEIVGHCATKGAVIRHFSLTAEGDALLVANQVSSSITVFRVDKSTGLLEIASITRVPYPAFVKAFAA